MVNNAEVDPRHSFSLNKHSLAARDITAGKIHANARVYPPSLARVFPPALLSLELLGLHI